MEEDRDEATQQATQIVLDPRRLGQQGGSGLSHDDLSNICCILHPVTLPACRAAADVYHSNPQHAISAVDTVQIRENNDHGDVEEYELDAEGIMPCDIALRLSSNLKDPPCGFVFGRNKGRCDVVIGEHQVSKRISNVHFRIYINEYGVIMLEDQSTNGTAVDGVLLRGKDKENGKDYRHTLEQGSIITLTMTPPEVDYRFVVRIPQRDDDADQAYERNLTAYFLRMKTVKITATGGKPAPENGKAEPINLFPNRTTTTTPNPTSMTSGRSIKEWKGGAKYNKIGCIGKGAFAVVYKITAKFDGIPYAAKELEKRRFMKNGILDQKVDMEMKIMRQIQHPHVVRFIEHVDFEDKLYIIMEYIPGGDLGSIINQEGPQPETNVRSMATQLLGALKYLHEKGITHRDVKPDNILISSHDPLVVKLTDFGLSKMIDSEETFLRTFCGTLLYCAPEVYQEYREYDAYGQRQRRDRRSLPPQRYGHAVDIWSLAGVLFFALCGSPPYRVKNGVSYQELLNQIMTTPLDIRPLQVVNISEVGIRFVRKMLHIRPEHRATIDELQRNSWLTGAEDTFAASMDSESASIVDDFIDPYLQHVGSQLSIHDRDRQIEDSGILGNELDLNPKVDQEIPSSFSTDDVASNRDDSLDYVPATAPSGNPNGRLFGEVNLSDFDAKAHLDVEDLGLPTPRRNSLADLQEPQLSNVRGHIETHQITKHTETSIPQKSTSMLPPAQPRIMAIRAQNYPSLHNPSLQFAESMVDKLNMNSPAAGSDSMHSEAPANNGAGSDQSMIASLRRSRYDYESEQQPEDWSPPDMPQKRRRQSAREIHMQLPATVFWDPRDRSTHHYNYPRMSNVEFDALQEYAAAKGEKFRHGHKTFDATMQSFRTTLSRSPSMELESTTRAHSEPTKTEGRQMLMKRDDRRLSNDMVTDEQFTKSQPDEVLQTKSHPQPLNLDTTGSSTSLTRTTIDIGFQPPKKILARFVSEPDSCLPTITFNITDPVTSWGRGTGNTLRSVNDRRIPEHAFKLVLFKPGFFSDDALTNSQRKWTEDEEDLRFYISTKAQNTIYINNVQLKSYASSNSDTESKFWGELRHNDVVTVWWNVWVQHEFTRFRFECLWGKSKEERWNNDAFDLVPEGSFLAELEKACLSEERRQLQLLAKFDQGKKDDDGSRHNSVETFSNTAVANGTASFVAQATSVRQNA